MHLVKEKIRILPFHIKYHTIHHHRPMISCLFSGHSSSYK